MASFETDPAAVADKDTALGDIVERKRDSDRHMRVDDTVVVEFDFDLDTVVSLGDESVCNSRRASLAGRHHCMHRGR